MDGHGNSVTLWDERTTQDQLWSRRKLSAGNWGAVAKVSPALQTTSGFPAIKISTTGFATAVWTDENGRVDRRSPGLWEMGARSASDLRSIDSNLRNECARRRRDCLDGGRRVQQQ